MTIAENYRKEQSDWKKQLERRKAHGVTRLSKRDKIDIIKAYEINLEPMMSIALKFHVTRNAIWKMLKKAGIDTSKRKIQVSCKVCGTVLNRQKSKIRNNKNHFCNMACYQAFLDAGASHLTPAEQRRGSRMARKIVQRYFNLQPENIVHHKDHFSLNNQLWNLCVFKTQGDHIRHHRGFEVETIWDGSDNVIHHVR